MIKALSTDGRTDLRPFLRVLRDRQLRVQVTEESGSLVLWTVSDAEADHIRALFDDWQAGVLDTTLEGDAVPGRLAQQSVRGMANGLLRSAWYAPVSVLFIAACLLIAAISQLGTELQAVRYLFFPELGVGDGNRLTGLFASIQGAGDVLRMFTPALLHFGIVHLVFNMLWLWYFGRMIETQHKSWVLLLLVLFTAFWANVAQFLWSGQTNFGGMSGVVYGLIGYIWMWQTFMPRTSLWLPPAMIGVFLVALVLMELVASSWIATAAHAGGLISGMLAGFLMTLYSRHNTAGVR